MTAQLVMCLLALQGPVVSFLVPTYKKMGMVACLLSQPWGGRGKKSSAILWPATLHWEFQVSERTCVTKQHGQCPNTQARLHKLSTHITKEVCNAYFQTHVPYVCHMS